MHSGEIGHGGWWHWSVSSVPSISSVSSGTSVSSIWFQQDAELSGVRGAIPEGFGLRETRLRGCAGKEAGGLPPGRFPGPYHAGLS